MEKTSSTLREKSGPLTGLQEPGVKKKKQKLKKGKMFTGGAFAFAGRKMGKAAGNGGKKLNGTGSLS